jgi:parvulin-like peptidyl-prolyl isomerase
MGFAQNPPSPQPGGSTDSAPQKATSTSDRVVLKVGSTQVTQAEFETRIQDIEGQGDPDKEGAGEKERRRLGDDYASVLMLSQQAVANHLDSSPEVARQLAISRIQILSDAEFARLMRQSKPTFEEISQYYGSHLSDYDEVQIRRLFIWKQGPGSKNSHGLSPQAARASADAILAASAAGRDTAKLTEEFNDSNHGLVDPHALTFPRGELPPAMERVAFAGKEGQWSQVQDTPESIILVQLLKRDHQQVGQVSSIIEKRIQRQKMQALLDELKKNAGIWMDEQYFGTAAPATGEPRSSSNLPSKFPESTGTKESKNER